MSGPGQRASSANAPAMIAHVESTAHAPRRSERAVSCAISSRVSTSATLRRAELGAVSARGSRR